MKINFYLLFICIMLFSCKSDPCEELDCGLHGMCDEETEACICDSYYEGDLCESEIRSKYIGNWTGMGECDYNPGNFFNLDVIISAGDDVNIIKIQPTQILQEFTFTGMLDENNNILIPEFQSNLGSNLYDGQIINSNIENTIVMILNAYVNGEKTFCTYTLSK